MNEDVLDRVRYFYIRYSFCRSKKRLNDITGFVYDRLKSASTYLITQTVHTLLKLTERSLFLTSFSQIKKNHFDFTVSAIIKGEVSAAF